VQPALSSAGTIAAKRLIYIWIENLSTIYTISKKRVPEPEGSHSQLRIFTGYDNISIIMLLGPENGRAAAGSGAAVAAAAARGEAAPGQSTHGGRGGGRGGN
jgi:hypothetical protein